MHPRSILGAPRRFGIFKAPSERGKFFGAGGAENFVNFFAKIGHYFKEIRPILFNLLENLLTKLQQLVIIDLFDGFFEICKLF